ncbi:MAG: N-acetylmuramic acid 6-phosphate etherase [Deltaproteobacteria bacterium]|nr:N-acetylmuramic acid 6-phosphate etherase [Deltaproteobacteria bacterium]
MQKAIPHTEGINPASRDLDMKSIAEIIEIMNNEDRRAVEAVYQARNQIERAVEVVVETFNNGGRLFYIGAGTSGRLGALDASECPPTFSAPPEMVQGIIAGGDIALRKAVEGAEDDEEAGRQAIHENGVRQGDMVIGISASGLAVFVSGALEEARMLGAKAWLLTCNPDFGMRNAECGFKSKTQNSKLKTYFDGAIAIDTGAEVIAGSTRLKAGTATKLVLNMITTISMVKTGKVYGNLMVDVNPTNKKLKERAVRIISEVAQCSMDEAGELLVASGNIPKMAVVMKIKGVERVAAEKLLAEHKGILRETIK